MGRPIHNRDLGTKAQTPVQRDADALFHTQCLATLQNRLSVVPIPQASSTLALGAGADVWAVEVARRNAEARVRSSPDLVAGLQSCKPKSLDLVYIRCASGCVQDWRSLYQRIRRRLRPGGWIEQVECSIHLRDSGSGALSRHPSLAKWSKLAVFAATKTGKTFEVAENMAGLMREAGFEDVVEQRFRWPVGGESQLGRLNLMRWEAATEAWMGAAYAAALGWSPKQTKAWLERVKAALREEEDGVWHEVRVVYARKPA